MAAEPGSFRDRFVSLFQSAVDQVVRNTTPSTALVTRPGTDNALVNAAAAIGSLTSSQVPGQTPLPDTAPGGIAQDAWTCAKMGFALLQARARGDTAGASSIEDDLRFNVCDPAWIKVIESYVAFFGPDGKGASIPYRRAATIGPVTLPLKAGATVALIADWGTGTQVAVDLLEQAALQNPDVVIHLGDIYYSGTPEECDANFRNIVDTVLARSTNDVPVYTLAGNHDMYSGGAGYYGLIDTLNDHARRQPASFFCLRNDDWQFIAMDTGLHDYIPIVGNEMLTFLEKDEEDWITERIAEFGGKTILLSHHQLFSALSQIGPLQSGNKLIAHNPKLLPSFQRFAQAAKQPISAWFWGHEHNLSIYQPYLGLNRGRCIGHGAVPVLADGPENAPDPRIVNPPALQGVLLKEANKVYMHGFTIIRLGQGAQHAQASAEYYESSDGTTPMFTEML
ncbi:metallophosphoesterase [Paraburkholderia sp. Tr-20389]|uniref:metallophosphoesterase family protein n=1 Tax=Paraburkholderia sp. Tr-20389 TaxID=2703903 RepID=UPI001980809F|nr:metallophosphoesterase [Paraburkholderia sp. Tr-20389]MBN3757624.1 metallophosphoesterase [Paraburkholderia sp. Tr-20389]